MHNNQLEKDARKFMRGYPVRSMIVQLLSA